MLVVLALLAPATHVQAQSKPRVAQARRAMDLFASPSALFTANRVFCRVASDGHLCAGAAVFELGNVWPRQTLDPYVYGSGLQVAGIIPVNAGGGRPLFPWAGDTVGAVLVDLNGNMEHGTPLSDVFDSFSAEDIAQWPTGGVARDTAVYAAPLIGRATMSQQDLWWRTWDGSPSLLLGRTHPMGILVDQRVLGWNYPEGNEDVVYFVFTIYNVTARDPAVYANPTIPAAIRAEIAAVGAQFQDSNEARLGVSIPDGGYSISQGYFAVVMDHDVARFSRNYSTVSLPFEAALGYTGDFLPEVGWTFPVEVFGPPFLPAPGFVGVSAPRRPPGSELAMFTNFTSGVPMPVPQDVRRVWRLLSGYVSPLDPPCAFGLDAATVRARKFCFVSQVQVDSRFQLSFGPFTLNPGEAQTVVAAYLFAAPLDTARSYVGGDVKPGFPSPGDSIFLDPGKISLVERIAGWQTQADRDGDGIIEAVEVTTVPRSLLDKARVAQAVVDRKFLLPMPPERPEFFLVPGDNQVTVAWQPSATETTGDPYFAAAADVTSPLHDPNYRQFDVEGYRIYRGRTPAQLELIAQVDYAGTTITDYTGRFAYAGDCAPELGIQTDCPVAFDTAPPFTTGVSRPLVGPVVQVPAGGRVVLGGSVFVLRADTAVVGGAQGFLPLTDTGVNLVFVDSTVRNGFQYAYAVTAFDVNSLASGPSSLESPIITKLATPRRSGVNVTQALLVYGVLGGDGTSLDPSLPYPAMDSNTGTFNGIMPPANDGALTLLEPVLEALPPGDITVRIDSVTPALFSGFTVALPGPTLHVTLHGGADTMRRALAIPANGFRNEPYSLEAALVPYDSVAAQRFGLTFTQDVRMPMRFSGLTTVMGQTSGGVATDRGLFGGSFARDSATRYLAHSRWFDEVGPEMADPTIEGIPSERHHAGRLAGVTRIWAPQAYRDRGPGGPATPIHEFFRGYSYGQTAWYPADFAVTWNADSSITVRDSTHRTTLPWGPNGGTGFGFLNTRAFAAAGVSSADLDDGTGTPNVGVVGYHHLYAVPPLCSAWKNIPCVRLERTAEYQLLDFNHDGLADGMGIALLVNGEAFLMETAAVPASGSAWHLRAVSGVMTAGCSPRLGVVMTDCATYTFTGPVVRPSYAPGLTYRIRVQPAYTVDTTSAGDLSRVHTVPDPLYVVSGFQTSADTAVLRFVNLPSRAIIRIYSVSGILVAVLPHDDVSGGGETSWNLRSRNGRPVASGVYFYHVEATGGRSRIGRFTVITRRP